MIRKLTLISSLVALIVAFAAAPAEAMKVRTMMAPPSACVAQNNSSAPVYKQERAMRCMTNYARRKAGMRRLARTSTLGASANRKGQDILRCDSFSHFACGRDFTFWLDRVNYTAGCWTAGENLAWGTSNTGTARSVFRAWMHSPEHRANILRGAYSQFGVSLRVGNLGGESGAHVWVQHFGDRC